MKPRALQCWPSTLPLSCIPCSLTYFLSNRQTQKEPGKVVCTPGIAALGVGAETGGWQVLAILNYNRDTCLRGKGEGKWGEKK